MSLDLDKALLLLLRLPSLAHSCEVAQQAYSASLPHTSESYTTTTEYLKGTVPLIIDEASEGARGELESHIKGKSRRSKPGEHPSAPWPIAGLPVVYHPISTRVLKNEKQDASSDLMRGCIATGELRAPVAIRPKKPKRAAVRSLPKSAPGSRVVSSSGKSLENSSKSRATASTATEELPSHLRWPPQAAAPGGAWRSRLGDSHLVLLSTDSRCAQWI